MLSTVYASSKPEAYKLDALNKTHAIIKKQYKQYSSKVGFSTKLFLLYTYSVGSKYAYYY